MAELKLDNIYKIYDDKVTAVEDFNLHIQDKDSSYSSAHQAAVNLLHFV